MVFYSGFATSSLYLDISTCVLSLNFSCFPFLHQHGPVVLGQLLSLHFEPEITNAPAPSQNTKHKNATPLHPVPIPLAISSSWAITRRYITSPYLTIIEPFHFLLNKTHASSSRTGTQRTKHDYAGYYALYGIPWQATVRVRDRCHGSYVNLDYRAHPQ
jgi:hypothetical protein